MTHEGLYPYRTNRKLITWMTHGPVTEIIFHCEKGAMAQTALETALSLGYGRAYNLGALLDWTYESE